MTASDIGDSLAKASAFDLEIGHFTFELAAVDSLVMPRENKGNVLRGAFGSIFKELCCGPSCSICATSPMRAHCPYAAVFEPSPPPGSNRLSANRDIPRPFVFRPPLDSKSRYERGETFEFDLVLFGNALTYFPYFVVTFRELSERGLGIGRGRCRLLSIRSTRPGRPAEEVYSDTTQCVRFGADEAFHASAFFTEGDAAGGVQIEFLSPTLIKHDGREVTAPAFHQLIKRLRDRINALACFYGGTPLDMDFAGFGRRAEAVETVEMDTRWVHRERYSSRKGERHPIDGFVGRATYRGNCSEFMPFLRVGEWTHVGKHTVWGNGQFRVIKPASK
jgi:hypothetical protein